MKGSNKKTGNIIISLGVALVLVAFIWAGYNIIDESLAQKKSQQALSQMELDIMETNLDEIPNYMLDRDIPMPIKTINGKDYIGAVSIPVLDVDLPVLSEWSYQNFRIAPCRYEGSAYKNDMILCAHNYRNHFGSLKYLTKGDRVYFTDMDKNKFTYEVMFVEVLDKGAVEELKSGEWDLTLFTCTYGGATRVVVRCELLV